MIKNLSAMTAVLTAMISISAALPSCAATAGEVRSVRQDAQFISRQTHQKLVAAYAADLYIQTGIANEALTRARRLETANTRLSRDLSRTQAERDAARAEAEANGREVATLTKQLEESGVVEAGLRLQIDAYARETAGLAETEDPRKREALRLYAAGLEEEAFPVIEEINRAQIAANLAREQAVSAALRADTAKRWQELAVLAEPMRMKGQKTLAEVITYWEQAQANDPTYHWGWVMLTRLYRDASRTDEAVGAAEQALATAKTDTDRWSSYHELVVAYQVARDLPAARRVAERGLDLARQLARAAPDNPDAQRNLSIALHDMADVLIRVGEREAAEASVKESVAISETLATQFPNDRGVRRDLAISWERLGDFYYYGQLLAEAVPAYERAYGIRRSLLDIDPDDVEAQYDLSVIAIRLGNAAFVEGEIDQSLTFFDEGVTILRSLSSRDPENMRFALDLITGLHSMSSAQMLSDGEQGAASLGEAYSLAVSLAAAHPDDERVAEAERDTVEAIGDFWMAMGDQAAGLDAYRVGLGISRRLLSDSPASRRSLWLSLARLCRADSLSIECRELALLSHELAMDGVITDRQRDIALGLSQGVDIVQ